MKFNFYPSNNFGFKPKRRKHWFEKGRNQYKRLHVFCRIFLFKYVWVNMI